MRKLITTRFIPAMALMVLIAGSAAIAQSGGGGGGGGAGGGSSAGAGSMAGASSGKGGGLEAPIGHRQPRAGDVPPEQNLGDPNDPLNRESAALDRKIKSICRGC